MGPFLEQIIHSVHVFGRSRDVETVWVRGDTVAADSQSRGLNHTV